MDTERYGDAYAEHNERTKHDETIISGHFKLLINRKTILPRIWN